MKYDLKDLEHAETHLQRIITGELRPKWCGLCTGATLPTEIVARAAIGWKYAPKPIREGRLYDGYPILSGQRGVSPKEAYEQASNNNTMYVGEYGRRRLQFARRCLKIVREELMKCDV